MNAVADRDLPIVEAFVAVVAIAIILVEIGVEIAARLLDPRLGAEPALAGGATA